MTKKYFSIADVAEILKEEQSTLRFWEKKFKIEINRRNGIRQYVKEDIEKLKNIQYLRREQGFTTEGAKDKLSNKSSNVENVRNTIEILNRVRKELIIIRHDLNQTGAFAESVIIE